MRLKQDVTVNLEGKKRGRATVTFQDGKANVLLTFPDGNERERLRAIRQAEKKKKRFQRKLKKQALRKGA